MQNRLPNDECHAYISERQSTHTLQIAKLCIETVEGDVFHSNYASRSVVPSFVLTPPFPTTITFTEPALYDEIESVQNIRIQFNKLHGIVVSPLFAHAEYVCYSPPPMRSPIFGACANHALHLAILCRNGRELRFDITTKIIKKHTIPHWFCIIPKCEDIKIYICVSPAHWHEVICTNAKHMYNWFYTGKLQADMMGFTWQVIDRICIIYNNDECFNNKHHSCANRNCASSQIDINVRRMCIPNNE